MEVNFTIVGVAVFAVILLITFLIRRNRKDQKDYERDKIQSDIPAKKHGDEHT